MVKYKFAKAQSLTMFSFDFFKTNGKKTYILSYVLVFEPITYKA